MRSLTTLEPKTRWDFWRIFLLRYLPVVGAVLASVVVAEKIRNTAFLEEVARAAAIAVDFYETTIYGYSPIVRFGTESQKTKWLPALATGEHFACTRGVGRAWVLATTKTTN